MKSKHILLFLGITLVAFNALITSSPGQLPPSFPSLVISSNGPVAPGDFIGTFGAKGTATNDFNVVLDNSGTPLYTTPFTALWRTVTPSGLIAEANTKWLLRDETFSVVDTYPPGDGHDFKLLPNGDAILLEGESVPTNLSQVVSGGRPDAVLSSLVFQELDANQQIVFQWRAIDHLAITDSFDYMNVTSVDWTHANAITLDPRDNNYLVSLRGFCQILKISRTTGDVIWRLGGKSNDFTFIGENPTNAPYYFIGQHNIHGLANGDIMFFDNGSLRGQSDYPSRTYSRAVQYHIDETNMTATLVWEYRHVPDVLTPTEGIVKRFTNGNTYVGWVSAAQQGTGPVLTEVNASNQVRFELSAPGFASQTILTKQVWNSPALVHSDVFQGIAAGKVCTGTNSGVIVTVNSLTCSSASTLTVSYHDDAVRFPQFSGKAPQVLVPRVTLAGSNIGALTANLSFALPPNNFSFDTPLYTNPASLTVYQRATVGQGVFVPLATTYDPVAQTLNVTTSQLGEFIFTYPDLPEIPLPPILYGQATQTSVDQQEPVVFQWTPRGFAHAYHLQVATDSAFSNLVVDQAGLTNLAYTLSSLQAGTTYYWRVNVSNYGGLSDWATNSFLAAAPAIQVTSPNGGQAWQRGQTCFIEWNANISENVAIDLYQSANLAARLASSAPNLGAFVWSISMTNLPGSNYSIRISSSTNAAVYGDSTTPFSIVDAPTIKAIPVSVLSTGLPQQFAFCAPGAATATIWGATNLLAVSWQNLGQVPVTGSNGVFTVTPPYTFYRISVP
jgi:hypothetical protein